MQLLAALVLAALVLPAPQAQVLLQDPPQRQAGPMQMGPLRLSERRVQQARLVVQAARVAKAALVAKAVLVALVVRAATQGRPVPPSSVAQLQQS